MQMVSRGKKAIGGRKRSRPDASAGGGTERQRTDLTFSLVWDRSFQRLNPFTGMRLTFNLFPGVG